MMITKKKEIGSDELKMEYIYGIWSGGKLNPEKSTAAEDEEYDLRQTEK
jgi:hypothetical protein